MVDRTTKLLWRRRFRKKRKQVEEIGANAEQSLDSHLFKRLGRLSKVWRFTVSWVLLLILAAVGNILQIRTQTEHYQVLRPVAGGSYTEGIIGAFTTANPIYATSAADSSVAHLVFAGLLRYNESGEIINDMAQSIDVDTDGKLYTLKLRPNIAWHDGQPLTAEDVKFTYDSIKNPDVRSPFFQTWKDIKITTKDPRTVTFELPNALATFKEALTNGIVPKHLLKDIDPDELRTSKFNTTNPVGSGPFAWGQLEVTGSTQETRQEIVGLISNKDFYRDSPKINSLNLRTFRQEDQMVKSYTNGELTSMVGLTSIPDNVREVPDFKQYSIPLQGEVMVFFKTQSAPLNDVRVRKALVQSVDPARAVKGLGYPVKLVHGPLLDSSIAYNQKLTQLPTDIPKADKYLDQAGWIKDKSGIRHKNGKPLTFTLFAQNTSDYSAVISYIQNAWNKLGVKVDVMLQSDTDLQGVVTRRDYDALLYGVSFGNDPDVFAYWHSSQASPNSVTRFNFSEYKSKIGDDSLEAGRTRLDPMIRKVKYEPFLRAWRDDAPALALYQPNFIYITRGEVFNFNMKTLSSPVDRYANVENWMIRQKRMNK